MGPRWFQILEKRKRENEGRRDWVVVELQKALASREVAVLPVVVEGTFAGAKSLEEELKLIPGEIEGLRALQIHRLRPDPDFKSDMDRLIMAVWEKMDIGTIVGAR